MKRTNANQRDQKLKRRLDLVRLSVRVLAPDDLDHVNGGSSGTYPQGGCVTRYPYTNL